MPGEQSIDLDPMAPFSLDLTAWALRRRSHNAVDRWGAAGYQRVMTVEDRPVAVSVNQDGGLDSPRLSVQLAGRPIDQHDEALVFGALRKLLGLTVDLTGQDALLGPLAERLRRLKPPRFPTVFEALIKRRRLPAALAHGRNPPAQPHHRGLRLPGGAKPTGTACVSDPGAARSPRTSRPAASTCCFSRYPRRAWSSRLVALRPRASSLRFGGRALPR
jgi:hypothetical protein